MNRLNTKILVVSTRCDHMIKQTAMKQQRRELKESVERETSEPRGPRLPPLVTTPKDGVMFLCHFVLPSTNGQWVSPSSPKSPWRITFSIVEKMTKPHNRPPPKCRRSRCGRNPITLTINSWVSEANPRNLSSRERRPKTLTRRRNPKTLWLRQDRREERNETLKLQVRRRWERTH